MSEPAEKRFLSIREVAELTEVTTRTVRRWCASGKIAAVSTPNGQHRIPIAALRDRADLLGYATSRADEMGSY